MLKIANQEVHYYLLIMCVIHHREEIASHVVPLLMAFTIYIYILDITVRQSALIISTKLRV